MENNMLPLISKRLRELRSGNNLTYDQVASILKIHRETVRRYEKNPAIMSIDIFIKMLDIYGYKTNIFFNEIYGNLPLI